MKSKYYPILILILSLWGVNLLAQQHAKITINIKGLNDSVLILAGYGGDKQFVIDTAKLEKNGTYVFRPGKTLEHGMYIIADAAKKRLFDFIVTHEQTFNIEGDFGTLPGSLISRGNKESQLLFDYMRFLAEKQKQQALLKQRQNLLAPDSDSAAVIKSQINDLNDQVQAQIKKLIASNQGTFFATFLKAMQEPELPEFELNTKADTLNRYQIYKKHFWDNTVLADDRLIRTPVVHPRVEQYLNKLTSPLPDSVITAIDFLLENTKNSKESFKYLMWYLTIKYERSEIMGYDAIFVHLVDRWFSDPRMDWMNATVKQNLIERANTLKPLLLGKPAPEMILFDTLMQPHSLYNIKAKYTLIYFWDPDCGHCKKETPLLKNFYKNNKDIFDLEVYAVCMDTSWKDMKNYIRKNETSWINVNGFYSMTPDFRELYDVHSSPVMFLLDERKYIIAKRLLSEQMETFIRQRE